MSDWIGVEDRLPEEGIEVIGYNGDQVGECFIMFFEDDMPIWAHADFQIFGLVTHWMPLPNPPQDK